MIILIIIINDNNNLFKIKKYRQKYMHAHKNLT